MALSRSLLFLSCLVLASGLLVSPYSTGQDGAEKTERFPPLDTDVMVPDLSPDSTMSESDVLARYRGHPSGPASDTPSRPTAPAIAKGPAEPIAPPPVDQLNVMLDWYPSPRHASLYVAKGLDLFRQQGLDVTLSTPADPEVPTKLLANSRVDLALTRQPLLHLQVDEGLPLVRVASLISVPLTALITRADSEINDLKNLKGKRIGHADTDSEQVLLRAMLAESGVTMEELDTPNVHYRLEPAMFSQHVDGVIGMRHLLPRALANGGMSTRVYNVEDHGVPLHDGLILVANRDELQTRRNAISRFIRALEEATAWILQHPEESWPLLIATEPTLDTSINRDAWPEIRARLTAVPGALSSGRYATFERYLNTLGPANQQDDVSRLAIDITAPTQ